MHAQTSRPKAAQVAEILGPAICAGDYAVGETLPVEAALTETLGVSRVTLREGIRALVALGLLEVGPRLGTRVRDRRHWNLLNRDVLRWMMPPGRPDPALSTAIDEARLVFEPAAAALAARRADPAEVAQIAAAFAEMQSAAAAADVPRAITADRRFHLAVLQATGNPVLIAFDSAIDAILGVLFAVAVNHMQNFRENLANHGRVLTAIQAGDPAAAEAAMRDTILFTRDRLQGHRITRHSLEEEQV